MYVQLKRVVKTRLLLHEKTIALNSERDMFSLKYHYESLNLFSFSRAFFGSNIRHKNLQNKISIYSLKFCDYDGQQIFIKNELTSDLQKSVKHFNNCCVN